MTGETTQSRANVLSRLPHGAAIGLTIVAFAIAMRLPGLVDPQFWRDEMISLGIAGDGFFDTFVSTFRFSAHPPAYYAQLNLWMLGGKNASYILLNSVLWNVAAVAAIFYMGRSIIGEKTAALAALLFAIMPQSLYFAETARMYSMICFLQVWGWWSAERMAGLRNAPEGGFWRALAGLSAAQLLIGFSHGIGLIFSACLGLFALVRLWQEAAPRRALTRFLYMQSAVGAILSLILISGIMRPTQHEAPQTLVALYRMLAEAMLGPRLTTWDFRPFGYLIYLISMIAVFLAPRIRSAVIILVLLPIGAFILTALTTKPVLAVRPLALTLPFVALSCAATLSMAYDKARQHYLKAGVLGLGLIIVAGLFFLSARYITRYEKEDDFRSAAADLAKEAAPGESLVVVETWFIMSGLNWYLSGPESVSVLKYYAPVNSLEVLSGFFDCLKNTTCYLPGNDLFSWAGVPPSRDAVIWNNVPIVLKQQFDGNHLKYKSIWLVWSSKRSAPEPAAELLKTTHKQISEKTYRGLTIRRYDAPD